jgi:hypothetical protein
MHATGPRAPLSRAVCIRCTKPALEPRRAGRCASDAHIRRAGRGEPMGAPNARHLHPGRGEPRALCVRCTHTTSPTGADPLTRRGCASDARSWMSGTQRRQNHASPARVRPDTPRRKRRVVRCVHLAQVGLSQPNRTGDLCTPRTETVPRTLQSQIAAEGRLRPVGTTWRLLGLDEVAAAGNSGRQLRPATRASSWPRPATPAGDSLG